VKTLIITPELFASEGGITRILRLYLRALCELCKGDGEVRVLALNDSKLPPDALARYTAGTRVEAKACGRSKLAFIVAALRMSSGCERIVCGHIAQLPLAWAASWLRPGLRYYLVAHGIEVWRPFTLLERLALRGATQVWCVSEFTRRQLLARCTLPEGRTTVLFNALDPLLAPKEPVRPPAGGALILTVTRLSLADSYKGVDHLIDAMPAVLSQIPEARLRIVGRGDGRTQLQERARSLGVAASVDFAGFVSDADLHAEFAGCKLFALPSEKEGFGLVYLEAMAHGRPCLAALAAGAPEVLTEDTGVLVRYGDVPGIAAALVQALRRDWSLKALAARSEVFSYLRFRERLSSLLSS
jgi:glycosyltransferase involved in cell wall biosynthesis